MRDRVVIGLFLVVYFFGFAQAGVYSWTDEKGVRHFSDTPVAGLPQVDVKKHGKMWTNSLGMQFVYLEPGTFIMGLHAKKGNYSPFTPAHKVTLTKGFQIQVTEVTQEQWERVMPKAAFSKKPKDRTWEKLPASHVSSTAAQYFVSQLNKLHDGGRYQIPTEAQWEYACRAGQASEFNWGSDIAYPDKANFKPPDVRKHPTLKPAGSYSANRWQLYDMHGNVWEWCQEVSYKSAIDPKPLLRKYYESSSQGYDPQTDIHPVQTKPGLILRGGSFASPAYKCRSGYRLYRNTVGGAGDCGLRVIRLPED